NYARAGGALEQKAVASWSKHVDTVAAVDPVLAIEAARVAANYAASGGALEQQAAAKRDELQNPSRTAPPRKDAQAFGRRLQLG
ncbi:MAG: hypothetical protein ACREC4_02325, partial [Methylocella sp.]